jgi:hypothetical protein
MYNNQTKINIMETKYEKAIELLKLALLQNDEKDELQLSIEKLLIENGELPSPKLNKVLTKKAFKELCDVHVYTGGGRRLTAIFYDWKQGNDNCSTGFKYMVKGYSGEVTRKQLYELLYGWVTNGITAMPHYADYRFAPTDKERFKVPLSLR